MKKLSFLLIVIILSYCSIAQVKTKTFTDGIPSRLLPVKFAVTKTKTLQPPPEFYKLKGQPENENSGSKAQLSKIALPVAVDIDFLKEAMIVESNGIVTYALTIKVPDALNLSFHFNEFRLSENSILSIYNTHEFTDSIMAKENNRNNTWNTRAYEGGDVSIILKSPAKEKGKSSIKIGTVYLGYKPFQDRFGSAGNSEPCNINVICPLGAAWGAERNSVAIIQAEGAYASGALIMNTCSLNTPYFLTANHVLEQGGSPANWVFQFFYYSTDCNTNTGYREDVQFNGATTRANYSPSDFALLELYQTPAVNSGIYYSGWDRSGTQGFSTTGIHHPNHDVMKISRSNGQMLRYSGPNYSNNTHWQISWSQGITAVGSSGSPLFDNDHRIVGQLHSGLSFCSTPHLFDYYGSFDASWTGGGTNSTRLSNWLDPNNSGSVVTNTTGIFSLSNSNVALTVSGSDNICGSSSDYTVSGVPAGSTITWSVSDPSIATIPNPSNGTSVTVTRIGNGTVILTATSSNSCVNGSGGKVIVAGPPNIVGGYYSSGGSWVPLTVWGGDPFDIENTVCFNGNPTSTNTNMEIWNATSIVWSKVFPTSPNGVTWSQSNGNAGIVFKALNQSIGLKVTATNGCGSSEKVYAFKTASCGLRQMFTVSPNPASSVAIVSVVDNLGKNMEKQEGSNFSEIRIYDAMGVMRKIQKFNKVRSGSINLSGLGQGVYFIEISDGTHKERHQLLIQK